MIYASCFGSRGPPDYQAGLQATPTVQLFAWEPMQIYWDYPADTFAPFWFAGSHYSIMAITHPVMVNDECTIDIDFPIIKYSSVLTFIHTKTSILTRGTKKKNHPL